MTRKPTTFAAFASILLSSLPVLAGPVPADGLNAAAMALVPAPEALAQPTARLFPKPCATRADVCTAPAASTATAAAAPIRAWAPHAATRNVAAADALAIRRWGKAARAEAFTLVGR